MLAVPLACPLWVTSAPHSHRSDNRFVRLVLRWVPASKPTLFISEQSEQVNVCGQHKFKSIRSATVWFYPVAHVCSAQLRHMS